MRIYSPQFLRIGILDSRGQAAIFVALMFNVLFVFFAMCINIALVVHDKINLQNSVDMASYYVASKQAEILDVIAHENYMIRQSWKLLAWRYRLLGTLGMYRTNPPHPVYSGSTKDEAYEYAQNPALCLNYKPQWVDVADDQNLCNEPNLKIPPLPQVQVVAGFLSINAGIAALSEQLRAQFDMACNKFGAINWWFSMSILQAFRNDQRNRKQVIFALAKDLSQEGDFTDLDGNSVLAGAQATFVKNLTFANKQSFEASGGSLKLFNSLSRVDPTQWLVEVKIIPTVLYTDATQPGCNASPQPIANLPQNPASQQELLQPWPQGFDAQNLEKWKDDQFMSDSDYQFSLGVEKNPWYMVYAGIQASTNPRQIFFPMGSGVAMSARSFAKPFGGRIGPWFKSQWNQGNPVSSGTLTDPLVAPRVEPGGSPSDPNDPKRLPNYSRYPGDKLGMTSSLALNALSGLKTLNTLTFDSYKNIAADMSANDPNDILSWDGQNNKATDIRQYEILALAPDLFDVTYYSVEPDFAVNYMPRLTANAAKLGIPSTTPVRPDLGFSKALPSFTVQDQIALQQSKQYQRSEAFYFIRSKANLLTAWLPAPGAFQYGVQQAMQSFGVCALPDDNLKFKTPGSCAAGGGRTGYSVKIVSRDDLMSDQHKIGGENSSAGALLNPPNTSDGW